MFLLYRKTLKKISRLLILKIQIMVCFIFTQLLELVLKATKVLI